METLINSRDYSESRIIISAPDSLSATGLFSQVSSLHWMQEIPANVDVLGDFRYDTYFRTKGGFLYAF